MNAPSKSPMYVAILGIVLGVLVLWLFGCAAIHEAVHPSFLDKATTAETTAYYIGPGH